MPSRSRLHQTDSQGGKGADASVPAKSPAQLWAVTVFGVSEELQPQSNVVVKGEVSTRKHTET